MRFQCINFPEQAGHIHRLGVEVIAACGDCLFPVAHHCVRREGNNGNTLRSRIGLESSRRFFSVNIGQREVHENEIRLPDVAIATPCVPWVAIMTVNPARESRFLSM